MDAPFDSISISRPSPTPPLRKSTAPIKAATSPPGVVAVLVALVASTLHETIPLLLAGTMPVAAVGGGVPIGTIITEVVAGGAMAHLPLLLALLTTMLLLPVAEVEVEASVLGEDTSSPSIVALHHQWAWATTCEVRLLLLRHRL